MKISERQVYQLLRIAQDSLRTDNNTFSMSLSVRTELVNTVVSQTSTELKELKGETTYENL